MRRTAAVLISFVMILTCGSTAFAEVITHNIEADGDLTIGEEGNSNTYVVTGTGAETNHRIIVNGATTTITLKNVNIVTNNQSAIDIGDDADVELVVDGANSLNVTNSLTEAGIHVSGGSLTISGTDADDDILTVLNTDSNGATIGSDGIQPGLPEGLAEDFTGTIVIDGGVTLNSGFKDVPDTIIRYGTGIGSGGLGDMNGTIIINEDSVVNAYSVDYGAGIGSGSFGDMNGAIIINGGDVVAASGWSGAGIGTGDVANMNGTIEINGGNINASSLTYNGGIGTGNNGLANGDITIKGDAVISLGNKDQIGANQQSSGTIYICEGATINDITVTSVEELKDAGILNDNMNVELIEKSSSYSLGKLSTTSRIKSAKSGDKVYIYESELSKGKLPYYVLEALSKTDNVTLFVVGENGETVEINSSNIPDKGKNAFFTFDELLEITK